MSRIGKLPIEIPKGVKISFTDSVLSVQGPNGALTRLIMPVVSLDITKGFQRDLEINGVGYRAEVKGKVLVLALGYSHPVNFPIPDGISVDVEKMTKLSVKGFDKELVGQTAAKIRSFRSPEPYKGKGIKYADETILRKAGKTGKK